jgi:hypothetical protein
LTDRWVKIVAVLIVGLLAANLFAITVWNPLVGSVETRLTRVEAAQKAQARINQIMLDKVTPLLEKR